MLLEYFRAQHCSDDTMTQPQFAIFLTKNVLVIRY